VSHRGPYARDMARFERHTVRVDLVAALEESIPELQRLERSWVARGTPLYALDLRRHRQLAERLLAVLRGAS